MTDALRQTLRTKLSELIKFSVGTLLLSTAAGAHAQAGNDTLKSTSYNMLVGDVNGDGREDVLMKAMPRITMIPLDDDLTIPIAIPAKTPSFALMSDAYWGYVLVSNPDAQLLQSNWSAASSGTLQFGVSGQHADTVRIQSASGEFIVAFSDVSQQLSLVQQPGVVKVPGTVTYIHTDGLGSPVARTNAAGQLLSRTLYEPYGYVAMGEAPTIGFTGHVNDADTGLTYMQQRYYDPVAGRFLSIDPVVTDADTGGGFNRYAYANNSPYKYIDPDGRLAFLIPLIPYVATATVAVVSHYVLPGRQGREDTARAVGNAILNQGNNASPAVGQGCIYCVPGDKTSSGKDYIGSADDMDRRSKDSSDGRDRRGAPVIDTYPLGDREERRRKEQQAINDKGGLSETDNKRNEIRETKWGDKGVKPPPPKSPEPKPPELKTN